MDAYGSDLEFAAWLAAQGLSLSAGAPAATVLRTIGSAYLDAAYEQRLQCSMRAGGLSQALAWPRTGHTDVADDVIPERWIAASYRAAYLHAAQPGWAMSGTDPGRLTKREKADVIEREFFSHAEQPGADQVAPGMPFDALVNAMVQPLFCTAPAAGSADLLRF